MPVFVVTHHDREKTVKEGEPYTRSSPTALSAPFKHRIARRHACEVSRPQEGQKREMATPFLDAPCCMPRNGLILLQGGFAWPAMSMVMSCRSRRKIWKPIAAWHKRREKSGVNTAPWSTGSAP